MSAYTEKLLELETMFAAALRERHPEYTVVPGTAVYSTVVKPLAVALAGTHELIQSYVDARSVQDIRETLQRGGTLAPGVLDAVAANFAVERRQGAPSAGYAALVVSKDVNFTISTDTLSFTKITTGGTVTYRPVTYYYVVNSGGVMPEDDSHALRLYAEGGEYVVYVPVQSDVSAEAANIQKGTALAVAGVLQNTVRAFAYADFTGGDSEESDEDLVARLLDATAPVVVSNRASYGKAMAAGGFDYVDYAAIGAGNAVMHRDSIDGEHTGGLVDLYVKTRERVPVVAVDVDRGGELPEGVDIGITTDVNPSAFFEIADFYALLSLQALDDDGDVTATYLPGDIEITYGEAGRSAVTAPPAEITPVYGETVDCVAFSAYRTIFIGGLPVDETATKFRAEFLVPQGIVQLQRFFSGRETAPVAGDVLVRAAVPVFVTATVNIEYAPGEDVDSPEYMELIDKVICDALRANRMGTRTISAAGVMAAVGRATGGRCTVPSTPRLSGYVILPSGGVYTFPKDVMLRVPDCLGVSNENTAVYAPYGETTDDGVYCPSNIITFTRVS